jgi:hypothetical protein
LRGGAAFLAASLLLALPITAAPAFAASSSKASIQRAPEFTPAADTLGPTSVTPARWARVAPGIEFARVEAVGEPHGGSAGIAVVRLDPGAVRIEPYHETEYPGADPVTIDGWQKRLNAPVVVNAGLYDEARRHLGRLRRGGVDLGGIPHTRWKGVLVSGARADSLPPAALLDLTQPGDSTRMHGYANLLQSMMLFDARGTTRVRESDRTAPRTLVAADDRGRIYLVVTEGSYTLAECVDLLRGAGWRLRAALALDGGSESNLAVESVAVRYRSYTGAEGEIPSEGLLRAGARLPAVVAVWPAARYREDAKGDGS